MNDGVETEFVQAFIIPEKRERYIAFLRSPKRRTKFLRELHHFRDFDSMCVVPLVGANDSSDGLLSELRRRGATDDCHVISVRSDLDGATKPLADVVRLVFAAVEGTIILCLPGKLAYYEGEAPRNRFILDRRGHNAAHA